MDITELQGEVLTHIDVDESKGKVLLTTQKGRQILLHHIQDCCEHVYIENIEGEWLKLLGKPLQVASGKEEDCSPESREGSGTRTTFKFKVDNETVVCKWVGESNGYYSESVNIEDITQKER
jgi:hypothetical protein